MKTCPSVYGLVPETGLEPVRSFGPLDFKSSVSAYSTTPAYYNTYYNISLCFYQLHILVLHI